MKPINILYNEEDEEKEVALKASQADLINNKALFPYADIRKKTNLRKQSMP